MLFRVKFFCLNSQQSHHVSCPLTTVIPLTFLCWSMLQPLRVSTRTAPAWPFMAAPWMGLAPVCTETHTDRHTHRKGNTHDSKQCQEDPKEGLCVRMHVCVHACMCACVCMLLLQVQVCVYACMCVGGAGYEYH